MTEQRNYSEKACKNLCGFFGTESNDGYCSVCYKEHLKEKEKKAESVAGRGGSPGSPTNRQSLSSDCIIPGSSNLVSTFPSDTGQSIVSSRVSPTRKASLSDVACKIRQDHMTLPQSPRAQEVPPVSALKSGSGMPGYQETFEIPIEEEYEEDGDAFQGDDRSVLQSCNERCQSSRVEQTALFVSEQDTQMETMQENEQESVAESDDTKRKTNRCGICNKKLGLTGFKCRCGGQFCSIHRYSDKHECSFDYKEYGQRQIRKNNPVVSGEKISKI